MSCQICQFLNLAFFYKGYKATLPNSLSESTSLKVAQMVTL